MAAPQLGSKHQCQNCGTKFFDLSRNPIVCPKCGTVFQAAPARSAARAAPVEDEPEPETAGAEIVSLEEADAGAEKVDAVVADDIEIEEDDTAEDETFLEEEEAEPDDVTGLIGSDIEDDEET